MQPLENQVFDEANMHTLEKEMIQLLHDTHHLKWNNARINLDNLYSLTETLTHSDLNFRLNHKFNELKAQLSETKKILENLKDGEIPGNIQAFCDDIKGLIEDICHFTGKFVNEVQDAENIRNDDLQRAEKLEEIAQIFFSENDLDKAFEIVKLIPIKFLRDSFLNKLCEQILTSHPDRAFVYFCEMEEPRTSKDLLVRIFHNLAVQNVQNAVHLVSKIPKIDRELALIGIAVGIAEKDNDISKATEFMKKYPSIHKNLLLTYLCWPAAKQNPDDALKMISSLPDSMKKRGFEKYCYGLIEKDLIQGLKATLTYFKPFENTDIIERLFLRAAKINPEMTFEFVKSLDLGPKYALYPKEYGIQLTSHEARDWILFYICCEESKSNPAKAAEMSVEIHNQTDRELINKKCTLLAA